MSDSEQPISERLVVLLIAAIQFINILDFMIVMPLGPDFTVELGIPSNYIGLIAGSYTGSAAIAGVAGAFFLDRFDRRKALAVAMLGLIGGTFLCALSWNLETLIAARVIAGLFGGPATALSLAVVADVVPRERRGRAMGTVMTSFSVASIAGVPFSLEIAHHFGWRAPFYTVAAMGLVIATCALWVLPPMRIHLKAGMKPPGAAMFRMITRPLPLLAYVAMMAMMFSAFTVIPNIPTYLVFNLGYDGESWLSALFTRIGLEPPSVLGPLYLMGGTLSLIVLQFVGRLTDRLGSATVSWVGAVLTIIVIYVWFIDYQPVVPALACFVCFMGAMSVRGVPARALDTKIPLPSERAAFMSMQSAVQHTSLALAAGLSSFVLVEDPVTKSLSGMATMGWIAIVFAILLPTFVTLAERAVRKRDAVMSGGGKGHTGRISAAGAPVTAPVPARAPTAPD
ncbi:MAG: MFS transporter [Planctomycetes bacterium]|nr:MFS transporter [Planctomycetota bacterium]